MNTSTTEETFFAPAGRADRLELSRQHDAVAQASFITSVIQTVNDMMLVLNKQRQIVTVNKKLLDLFGVTDQSLFIGLRPGEAIDCIHRKEGPDGCGTSEKCSVCGAVMTIMSCQETGEQSKGECRVIIARNGGTALDLDVIATPLEIEGTCYTFFAIRDIGPEKRLQVLERTFFHDVINTVGGLQGVAGILNEDDELDPEMEAEYHRIMVDLSGHLEDEIKLQKCLVEAERGEFDPQMKETDLLEALREVCTLYSNHIRTPGRTVVLKQSPECRVVTDRTILRRIIGNMTLNALEASPAGAVVTIALEVADDEVTISVANTGEIPRDIQLKMFKRSFSTKSAAGRGIGTYSMRLFGERYLGGRVGFASSDGQTVFYIVLKR